MRAACACVLTRRSKQEQERKAAANKAKAVKDLLEKLGGELKTATNRAQQAAQEARWVGGRQGGALWCLGSCSLQACDGCAGQSVT